MKDLLIAFLSVAILIGAWLVFFSYSENKIETYTETIKETILPYVEAEDWDNAYQEMESLDQTWHRYKKLAIFFLDTDTVNEIDFSLAKSVKYVKAEDVSNSSGELNAMIEQLTFLSSNDRINLANIF